MESRSLCGQVEGAKKLPSWRLWEPSRSRHSPRTAQASRVRTASLIFLGLCLGAGSTDLWASAPPPRVQCPFMSDPAGQAESLTSCVCAARLPNHPSSLPLHSFPWPITSFPELRRDPRMESSTKMLIVRELRKNEPFVNVRSLCARSRATAGLWGGGACWGGWFCSQISGCY